MALILFQIAQLGDKRFENPQTANLHRVLTDTMVIHGLMMEKKMADGGGEGQEEEGGGKENSVKEVPASPKKKQRETRKKLVSTAVHCRYGNVLFSL